MVSLPDDNSILVDGMQGRNATRFVGSNFSLATVFSPPKIKYSSPDFSTHEQTVEKWRKPLKIKGFRHFFSGKDRGKCENLTLVFPTFSG
jgi:hypothetical protein